MQPCVVGAVCSFGSFQDVRTGEFVRGGGGEEESSTSPLALDSSSTPHCRAGDECERTEAAAAPAAAGEGASRIGLRAAGTPGCRIVGAVCSCAPFRTVLTGGFVRGREGGEESSTTTPLALGSSSSTPRCRAGDGCERAGAAAAVAAAGAGEEASRMGVGVGVAAAPCGFRSVEGRQSRSPNDRRGGRSSGDAEGASGVGPGRTAGSPSDLRSSSSSSCKATTSRLSLLRTASRPSFSRWSSNTCSRQKTAQFAGNITFNTVGIAPFEGPRAKGKR